MSKQKKAVLVAKIAATPLPKEDPVKRAKRLARMPEYTRTCKAENVTTSSASACLVAYQLLYVRSCAAK